MSGFYGVVSFLLHGILIASFIVLVRIIIQLLKIRLFNFSF